MASEDSKATEVFKGKKEVSNKTSEPTVFLALEKKKKKCDLKKFWVRGKKPKYYLYLNVYFKKGKKEVHNFWKPS